MSGSERSSVPSWARPGTRRSRWRVCAAGRAHRRRLLRAVAAPLIVLGLLVSAGYFAQQLPGDLALQQGRGVPGVLSVESTYCGKQSCWSDGTWRADDGSRFIARARMDEGIAVGSSVATVTVPGRDTVYRPGAHPLWQSLALTLGCLLIASGCGVGGVLSWRDYRAGNRNRVGDYDVDAG